MINIQQYDHMHPDMFVGISQGLIVWIAPINRMNMPRNWPVDTYIVNPMSFQTFLAAYRNWAASIQP